MTANTVFWSIVLVIVLAILGPIATIWSLNTLFPALNIPYSFDTWCAVIVLGGVFKSNIVQKKG